MSFIQWTLDLATGFDDIDEQHQQLINCINKFYDADQTKDRDLIAKALQELIDCTTDHFHKEEQMLEEAGYHLLEQHKKVHLNFLSRMATYQNRFENGDDIGEELLNLLEGWLFRHIRINDHGYVEPVKNAGVR
ncbi:bacteriohemerythrin [Neisseria wadsworthii]|uniref:bacteriohemerythrin n=1 Tax=Neisseria wadsworthii TaxID=607711 RepID=UPI000D2FA52B|nr:bacteriohemerythrin [Neisseria wadsworthii]